MSANAASLLLAYYVDKSRSLPWRSPPGSPPPDPYRVWLSEVMLQQTTVAAVAPRFERFVERWPTVDALAAASDEAILGEWAGLGYYARARNLIACARVVAAAGSFPDSEDALRNLPGIGDYTAAAIAAIAFGRRAVVVDSNVARIVARLNGLAAPTAAQTRRAMDMITPDTQAGDFAQAMMDLGATLCRPRFPRCGDCPLQSLCKARASGRPEDFPAPGPRAQRPLRSGTAHWIERDGSVWLVRRPASGLLGAMAALPGPDWVGDPSAEPAVARVSHVFTHFRLDLAVVERAEPEGEGWWQPIGRIGEAGLPALYRKAVEAVLAGRARLAA